jgi:hypothetical protein
MPSQSKSETARKNGAKSKGPVTPEGKAKSSRNAVKHGLTAGFEALPGESEKDLQELLEAHQDLHQPVGALETDLVRALAVTRWRLRRIATLESSLFENELYLSEEDMSEDLPDAGDLGRLGFVFRKLADRSQALTLVIRYETSLTRMYDRTFKHLLAIQKLRNEPNPPLDTPPNSSASPNSTQPAGNDPSEASPHNSSTPRRPQDVVPNTLGSQQAIPRAGSQCFILPRHPVSPSGCQTLQ